MKALKILCGNITESHGDDVISLICSSEEQKVYLVNLICTNDYYRGYLSSQITELSDDDRNEEMMSMDIFLKDNSNEVIFANDSYTKLAVDEYDYDNHIWNGADSIYCYTDDNYGEPICDLRFEGENLIKSEKTYGEYVRIINSFNSSQLRAKKIKKVPDIPKHVLDLIKIFRKEILVSFD